MLSIIIPVFNEVNTISHLLNYLFTNADAKLTTEIIIVDGGSTDGTLRLISEFNVNYANTIKNNSKLIKLKLIKATKGRAKQLNAGAKVAKSEVLYFLHADSFPPKHFDTLILKEVSNGNNAGCFRMQFNSTHWWLRLVSWFTQFNWRVCRGGDQSQFVTKTLFDSIGGYNEAYTIYEDHILIGALYKRNQFVVIPKILTTSARLYQRHGVWKLQYHFMVIYIKKWCGASSEDLHKYYKKNIA